jgi:hypothetical protein
MARVHHPTLRSKSPHSQNLNVYLICISSSLGENRLAPPRFDLSLDTAKIVLPGSEICQTMTMLTF